MKLSSEESILNGVRIYLSGPMDFVVSRNEEKQFGWRSRLRKFLSPFGAIVYDPWTKPVIVGQNGYAENYEYSNTKRAQWTFEDSDTGRNVRSQLCDLFYPTVHINRRMVDICDLLIAYCPTNLYSVGTVNEIIRARSQNKPVLLVSPPVTYPSFAKLSEHLQEHKDQEGVKRLEQLKREAVLKENPEGIPSPWYLGILPEDYFFDGFGFSLYSHLIKDEQYPRTRLDEIEANRKPLRPLLPYLEKLDKEIPKLYDARHKDYKENSDWMILRPGVHQSIE